MSPRKKKTHIPHLSLTLFAGVFVILGGIVWGMQYFQNASPKSVFPKLNEISKIEVKSSTEKYTLEKQVEGHWHVVINHIWHIVEEEKINNLLESLQSVSKTEVVSTNPENQEKFYGMGDDQKREITLSDGKISHQIILGKAEGINKSYISLGGDETYSINQNLTSHLSGDGKLFWDKKIISFEKNKIQTLSITKEGEEKLFEKQENIWKDAEGNEVDIEKYFENLLTLSVTDYAEGSSENYEKWNLNKENIFAGVQLQGEYSQGIFIWKTEDQYYLTYSDSDIEDEIYMLTEFMAEKVWGEFFDEQNEEE